MGNPNGFIEVRRKEAGNRPVKERIRDFGEVEQTLNTGDRVLQASRCMDCGIPFCHWSCPVGSKIPEWQDAVYHENWKEASDILHETNDFPEFTGRVCPAPCEKSCVLAIHDEAVTIRENEAAIVEKSFTMGLITPKPPMKRTGKKVVVIGSGPAGLSVAARLNRMGHLVTVFEKEKNPGGLLRYGIPDFKLNKNIIDRRLKIFKEEGIIFRNNINAGVDVTTKQLLTDFDAICLSVGAMQPRELKVPGRKLEGIHFAMDYLKQQNDIIEGRNFSGKERITAKNKTVLVIGGGDTGSDCVGTANRQGAKKVIQIEILPKPPETRGPDNPWPFWPNTLKISSSHEEGCERYWSMATQQFLGKGRVEQVETTEVKWKKEKDGKHEMILQPESKNVFDADLVLLALGFTQPVHEGLLDQLNINYDPVGNILTDKNNMTSGKKIFAAGDATDGPSLVVKAIASGQKTASEIHRFLMEDNG